MRAIQKTLAEEDNKPTLGPHNSPKTRYHLAIRTTSTHIISKCNDPQDTKDLQNYPHTRYTGLIPYTPTDIQGFQKGLTDMLFCGILLPEIDEAFKQAVKTSMTSKSMNHTTPKRGH